MSVKENEQEDKQLKFRLSALPRHHINSGFKRDQGLLKLSLNISLLLGIIILLILYLYRIIKERRKMQRIYEEINFLLDSLETNPRLLQEGI